MSVGEKNMLLVMSKGFCFMYSLNLNFGVGILSDNCLPILVK